MTSAPSAPRSPRICAPTPDALRRAADLLLDGQLVVLPTETVYGLAARPDDPAAVAAIYAAKGRPSQKPISYLAPDLDTILTRTLPLPPIARRIAQAYWPGPLTLVLPSRRQPGAYDGFRIPDHPVALDFLRLLPFPPLVTSANLSDTPPALTADEAALALPTVPLVLDGGPSPGARASTVLRIDPDGALTLLREGPIPLDALAHA